MTSLFGVMVTVLFALPLPCVCVCGRLLTPGTWACARPAAALRLGADYRESGDGGSGRARVAPALGSENAAAGGAGGIIPWGARRRRAATVVTAAAAVLQQWQRQLDPSPRMLRGGDFGGRPESPAHHLVARRAAAVAAPRLQDAGPPAGAQRIGLRRATLALPCNSGGGSASMTCAATVAVARAR